MHPGLRSLRAAAVCLVLLAIPLPVAARTPALADLQVVAGSPYPQWGMVGDDEVDDGTQRGSWSAARELDGDRLRIHLVLTPPEVNPVMSPGPASLVTGVGLEYGTRDGGDIGFSKLLGSTWTPLDACTGDPCMYTAEVSVPLRPAQRFVAATDGIESPVVVVGFSLVRTFGQGTWLQVLRADDLSDGRRARPAGTTMMIGGSIPQAPVVPAAGVQLWGQGLRSSLGIAEIRDRLRTRPDPSAPVPTVTAQLGITTAGCAPHAQVQLVDGWDTVPFAGPVATVGPAGTLVSLPDGTDWSLLVAGSKIGQIRTAGQDLVIQGSATCQADAADDAARVQGRVTGEAASAPLPAPPAPVPWIVATEAFRSSRPSGPTLLAAAPDGFLSIDRHPATGWQVSRSADGMRWHTLDAAQLPRAVRAGAIDGAALAAADGRFAVAGIAQDVGGGDGFVAWTSTDGRTWAPATVDLPSGRPAGASLTFRSLVAADGRWLALADGDGALGGYAWTSTDGRSWKAAVPRPPAGTSLVAVSAGPSRLLGVARPDDPAQPDLLVTSADGRDWAEAGTLPVSGALAAAVGETAAGTIVAAFDRSDVAPIEAWVSGDGGTTWERTLDGTVDLRLDGLTVGGSTVIVAGSVRYGERGLTAVPWAATSRDGGRTWRASMVVNGDGDGRCATRVAAGAGAAVLTVADCTGDPSPRWRAALPG
jgi:hypothetical protein